MATYGIATSTATASGVGPQGYNATYGGNQSSLFKEGGRKSMSNKKEFSLKINEAKKQLKKILLSDKLVPFLWGAPGIGKSALTRQVAEENNWEIIDLRLSLLNPVDLRGLPYLDSEEGKAVWLPPEFLPTKGQGILFLDELNVAPTTVQQAAYQLVLDKRLGNYKFPDKWRIVAAGNRETDYAYVSKMPSPLANRLLHLHVEPGLEDWKVWAQSCIDERIIGFLNFRPKLLWAVPNEEDKAYPTPRSWEFVSCLLKYYDSPVEASPAIAGAVGGGTAKEFLAFLRIYKDLPDIEGVLAGEVTEVPEKPDTLYALCSALVARVSDDTLDNFLDYISNMPPEFSMLAVKDAAKNGWKEALLETRAYTKWANKFGKYLK